MNIRFEDFGANDKLVIRSITFGVAANAGMLILFAVLTWWARPHLRWIAVLVALLALVIVLRFGREEICTLDKLAGTVTIERAGIQGKRITERVLAEIVGIGIKTIYIREGIGHVFWRPGGFLFNAQHPPMQLCYYCAYFLDSSGEHLDIPGVISRDLDEVSNAVEKIRDFLELGSVITE